MGSSGDPLTSIEICAGAGGQAVGLHGARFAHLALVEIDKYACETLRQNVKRLRELDMERKPEERLWENCQVFEMDVKDFIKADELKKLGLSQGGLDLLAGGVPCPPFSHAGRQLGRDDERDLFPAMLELVDRLRPRAVMIENVRGIMDSKFDAYREEIVEELDRLNYEVCSWDLLEAHNFGVPQLRPRAILVAMRRDVLKDAESRGVGFVWPKSTVTNPVSVAEALRETMYERYAVHGADGLREFEKWHVKATELAVKQQGKQGGIAPTLVGGSKKHGGADLGPSRAKKAWAALGVNALGVANDPDKCVKDRDLFSGDGPMLTVEQAAIIQGFPTAWKFEGGKTARYRQVGNAFPPPVAEAVGRAIAAVLRAAEADGEYADAPQLAERVQAPSLPLAPSGTETLAPLDHSSSDLESAHV